MALYEKREQMPPHLAEIPYGFKNLWRIFVTKYDLLDKTFRASDVSEIYLNGGAVTLAQLQQLFDYNRDGCSLIQSEAGSGIYVTLTGYDKENGVYGYETLIEQSLDIQGVTSVAGDMVDNSNSFNPVVMHDGQKLDVTQYTGDQEEVNSRLSDVESGVQTNANDLAALKSAAITSITVNDEPVPVSDGAADIQISALTPDQLAAQLATKVDKTVAGDGGTIVKTIEERFDQASRTLTVDKTQLSLQTGENTATSNRYALADLLGITALEAIDKELFYFCNEENIPSLTGVATLAIANLYRSNKDGSIYVPATTNAIQVVLGIVTEYSGYNQPSRQIVGSIGRVIEATDTALTCVFTNLRAYAVYNKYCGYRAGMTVLDTSTCSLFYVKQSVPAPNVESSLIPITNSLYYEPVQDYSLMPSGSFWANFDGVPSAGKAYLTADARVQLAAQGAGYDEYIAFAGSMIPAEILTDADWEANISLWVTDGIQFTSRGALLDYLDGFSLTDRYKISNLGVVTTHYESGGIFLTSSFTVNEISASLSDTYQPIPPAAGVNHIAVFNSEKKLIDGGTPISALATATQGAKADTAVQTVTIAPGAEAGALQLTVDGNAQSAAVPGLGSAAFLNAGAFATAAQGSKADNALQSAVLAPGSTEGTLILTTNGAAQSEVAVPGLGTAAYSDATAYATAAQGARADSSVQSISIAPGTANGTIQYSVNGGPAMQASVRGLGSAAYEDTTAFATAAQGTKADTALQPSDVVDNLTSTDVNRPLSANQGRVLEQLVQSMSASGKPIGGFSTYADRYTNTEQFSADLQPINVNDTIYIAADENHTDMPAQYRVASIGSDGAITYAFVRIVPDTARDFSLNPIQQNELAEGAVNSAHMQDGAVNTAAIANGAVTNDKLSSDVKNGISNANNALQAGILTSGAGTVVSGITENPDKTITVAYADAAMSVEVSGTGDFLTDASMSGERLTLSKNGVAVKTVSVSGSGNALSGATVSGSNISFTTDTMLKSIVTTGAGNVVASISPTGIATQGTAITSIVKSGTGNVITGVRTTDGVTTLTSGNALASVSVSGTGNVVSGLTASNGVLTATMGTAVTSLPSASTSERGVVQLNNTLSSTATDQALTAAQGKALSDALAASNAQNVKLTGNQTITGTKTLSSHWVVPAKTSMPTTPSSTQYATEAQVDTRIAKPLTSSPHNLAAFDGAGGLLDSGVAYASIGEAKTAAATALTTANNAIPAAQKGAANGVAALDATQQVPVAQLPAASTSAPGITQLCDAVNSTAAAQAATANAVKKAYDRADAAMDAALDKADPAQVLTGMLLAGAWGEDGTQTAALAGLAADAKGILGLGDALTDAQAQAALGAQLVKTAQAEGSVTIKAFGTVPEVDIPIQVLIVG